VVERGAAQPAAKRHPFDPIHHDVRAPVEHPDIVDRDDVGVAEQRLRARLADVARAAVRVELRQLDRDRAIELGIVRLVDEAHRACARDVEDRVAPDSLHRRRVGRSPGAQMRQQPAARRAAIGVLDRGQPARRISAPLTRRDHLLELGTARLVGLQRRLGAEPCARDHGDHAPAWRARVHVALDASGLLR
jgi:hypothetical protein